MRAAMYIRMTAKIACIPTTTTPSSPNPTKLTEAYPYIPMHSSLAVCMQTDDGQEDGRRQQELYIHNAVSTQVET